MIPDDSWRFWIDRGGTFTDIIARDPNGSVRTAKLLSEHPEQYDDAVVAGVRRLMGLAADAAIPARSIASVKLGTTVATNALLERRGAPTAFVTTAGFGDSLIIGDQSRPDIFALEIVRPAPLYTQVIEIAGRLDAEGREVTPLDRDAAARAFDDARNAGCEAAAICLMHACQNPAHEEALAAIADAAGFAYVAVSSRVDPLIKLAPRARTTLADAYLTPILRHYVAGLSAALGGAPLYLMTSAGGLMAANAATGRDVLLSGPAAGVVGMAKTAARAGVRRVLGFDMGGTSTDVSRFDGDHYERSAHSVVGGWRVRAPMLAVHTVAAGGGSILHVDGERAQVGPRSAGADPGPAAYGLGGPVTVTDANLVLGRLDARFFPAVFGPDGDRPLNPEASRRKLAQLAFRMGAGGLEAAAEGFIAVAIENMAQAVKRISTAQGYDPSDYALASFGGAGGQLACRVADALDIRAVLIHPMASVQSALGVALADLRMVRESTLAGTLDAAGAARARARADALEGELRDALVDQGADHAAVRRQSRARLRYEGTDAALTVPLAAPEAMRQAFENAHRRLFGFVEDSRIAIDSIVVEVDAPSPGADELRFDAPKRRGGPAPFDLSQRYEDGALTPCPVYRLQDVAAGGVVHGPALIVEPHSQIVVDRGWRAARQEDGMLVLRRLETKTAPAGDGAVDPVRLELFNRRFMAVAEDMGAALERTAKSVNMKERLDFSCAVFDREGGLVANAPHMPVHLGSMGASVRAALDAFPDLRGGEAVVVNAPAAGGTHLPDVTVVAPVTEPGGERLFFTAARGHHADIGGAEPGSMPPFSRQLSEEGVVIAPMKLLEGGVFQEAAVRAALASGPYPARNPNQNIADLKAQLAACTRGAQGLLRLVADHGREVVVQYLGHVQDNAEEAVRRAIARLTDGAACVAMDGGAEIRVSVRVDHARRSAVIDFAGTSAQQDTNFNAPAAIARAAALYVFRVLTGDDIPLNDGGLKPLEIRTPAGSLLDPGPEAAVVAGNVETSQHVVDALFLATGALAAAQGTMNNLTFGDAARQYYETIAGGAPAGPAASGADAVHTHMTNSRLTDPEVLEARFPVRVEAFGVRQGSGGAGARPGGDGVRRRLRFLAPMSVALLSTRRDAGAPGLAGGQPGAPGAQTLERADGGREALAGRFRVTVEAGDVIEILTPGAGGWGAEGEPATPSPARGPHMR